MPEFSRPQTRLPYDGPLDPVVEALCQAYDLGSPESFEVIALGYEDCNVRIQTQRGRFVAKMLSKLRTQDNRDRYIQTIQRVADAGVSHPKLHTTEDAHISFTTNGITMVVMDYIDGQSFWAADRLPNDGELRDVLKQASIINSIPYHPAYCYDSWAVPHIRQLYDRVRQFVAPEDLRLAEAAISGYEEIPIDELPHAFVHGDFTKANVMTSTGAKVYILDFAVSNWFPRIQELAVIAANLLHSDTAPISLKERCKKVATGYQVFAPLTDLEVGSLYAYALAAVAAEFLGAFQERDINGIATEETESWMQLGRNGLRLELGGPEMRPQVASRRR
jgi:Ser/Thr protein kinase RdoA (MazF antagonist)